MDTSMAYLLGMITGNGIVRRENDKTTVTIDIPHKKEQTETDENVITYVKASITDIRGVIDPLLGTNCRFVAGNSRSTLSFTLSNDEYVMKEILRILSGATSHENVRISPEVFSFTTDERKSFLRGIADVTGYIRKSNCYIEPGSHRVYIEVPQNWWLAVDICNLLKSVDIPVQNVNWSHPNMRDGNLKEYKRGKPLAWKKENQIKIYANEFQPIGFTIEHKQKALDYFIDEETQIFNSRPHRKSLEEKTHKYYWESVVKRGKAKPIHPCENDESIPEEIRGQHFDTWQEIADALGYNEMS